MTGSTSEKKSQSRPLVRLAQAVTPLAMQASRYVGYVQRSAGVLLLAGGWCWVVWCYPFAFDAGWQWGLVGLLLLVLALPAGILWLFGFGLKELVRLPHHLAETVASSQTQATALRAAAARPEKKGGLRQLWRLFWGIWALRAVFFESKDKLVQFAALLRFANPFFLGTVLGAAVTGSILVVLALLSTMWVLIF